MAASRILLVQNDEALEQRARAILQCAKYDVPEVVSLSEEIENIAEHCQPDLVLIDVALNCAKGVLAMVRSISSRLDVPVLCLAEYEDHVFLDQLDFTAPVTYLLKPYEDRELLTCVKAALSYHGAFRRRMNEFLSGGAFEHAPIGKALVGLDGRLLKVNKSLCELTGYPEHELTTKTMQDIIATRNGAPDLNSMLQMLRREKRASETEGCCYHKLGRDLCVLLNISLLDVDSQAPWKFMLQVQNAAKRKSTEESLRDSEQRYRKLVEATTSYIYTVEVENGGPKSTTHEQGCFFVTGYTSEEYAADPYLWYRMIYEEDRPEVIKQANAVLSGKATSPLEHRIIHKDGSVRWVRNTQVPRHDAQGRLVAYDGLINCITEERKLKDQLHHAQKMEAIGQLAAGIAHDFNNILTTIIGYGSLLGMKMKEHDPLKPDVEQILSAAERAEKLTQRLLAFSRKQAINPAPLQVNDVVKRVIKLLSRILGEDVQLKNTVAAGNNATIMGDGWQLEQVLINLATNARDAMPDGGLLTIDTQTVELDAEFVKTHGYGAVGTYACIMVTDTGIGMDEATRKRIFEPFFTTKGAGKGTGLGLAIAYGIVKQHNGYIHVYSEPGKGTTFKVYLPLVNSDVEVEKKPASIALLEGKETVLLAEDDEHVRLSMRSLLEHYGYTVIEAIEGEDAIMKFRAHQDAVELLILDVIMPKKNGKEVYEEIRKANPRVKALFTSGYTEEMVRQKGILESKLNFVTKPIPPAVFSRKIREVLDG